jgi:hypothetical protein
MLSPHEFSTLMLVRHSPDQIDMDRSELGTLLEHRLVALEPRAGGRLSLTKAGRALLEAMGRFDAALPDLAEPTGFDRYAAGH